MGEIFISVVFLTLCEGIHLYFNVVAVFMVPKRRYLAKLSLIGWVGPMVLVAITLAVEATVSVGYKMKVSNSNLIHSQTALIMQITYY